MERTSANPLYVFVFFLLRCLVPLLIMLGVSYVLRRLGLIKESPIPPDPRNGEEAPDSENGGLLHGSL